MLPPSYYKYVYLVVAFVVIPPLYIILDCILAFVYLIRDIQNRPQQKIKKNIEKKTKINFDLQTWQKKKIVIFHSVQVCFPHIRSNHLS